MKEILLIVALTLSTAVSAQDEVYMENQAGGYLALTHDECKVDEIKETFPYHAYGVDGTGQILGLACYQIPKLPDQAELSAVPQGMSVIPIVNVIDLEDGEVHTLEARWFSATKPGLF